MYKPVLNDSISITTLNPANLTTQIYNFQNMDNKLDNNLFEKNNNYQMDDCSPQSPPPPPPPPPPIKPPRRHNHQRSLSYQNTYYYEEQPTKMMKTNHIGDGFVDIDHIQIKLNNEKNDHALSIAIKDKGVQTTHLVPYRLRFWPRLCHPSDIDPRSKFLYYMKIISQWILSQIGLTIIVVLWALLGAYAFFITEGPREQTQTETLARIQRQLTESLANDLNQLNQTSMIIWHDVIHRYFEKHEILFLDAVGAGFGEGGGGNIWTYPGCILFSVSLLTTLGFGAPVPRTPLGRGSAVIFALVGIPLHFLLVLNIGNLSAIKIQQFAYKKPNESSNLEFGPPQRPKWLKFFPLIIISFYYLLGVALFGFARHRDVIHSFMFPLDFTASGGVANVAGVIRIFYALYLEIAVTLASLVLSLIQASASKGIVNVGLKWGLLTNT